MSKLVPSSLFSRDDATFLIRARQRYLPSAPAARRKLIMRTVEIGAEAAKQAGESDMQQQQSKWSNIYSHLYRESLTGCVAQLEELEKYTKLIVGEQR